MTGTGVATVGDCRIAYRRAGTSGPPIVLCHGAGIDDATVSWRHTIDALADDYRVYAIDWPEYGRSTGSVTHTIETYVDVLDGFLETLPYERVSLAGISMGGGAALGYALERPSGSNGWRSWTATDWASDCPTPSRGSCCRRSPA